MGNVLITISGIGSAPTLDAVKRRYGLGEGDIDEAFGLVEIDPEAHLYAILVGEDAAGKIHGDADWQVEGPFSNPRISAFGPPDGRDG